jgi:hypothetical protein
VTGYAPTAPADVYDAACRAWDAQTAGSAARLLAAVDAAYDEGVAAGRKQAAADVDAWANELAARTTRNSGQHETYACGKQMLVLTGHEANEGIVAATRKAARIAEGGEPNA